MSKYIKSPLNYIGGKHKLLPQILPLFPKEIDTFYDLFCGGANVGINIEANNIICNDKQQNMISLFNLLINSNKSEIFDGINKIISKYNLNKNNKNNYLKFRADFNASEIKDVISFYVLVCHSFCNQIRFNQKGEFNLPFGSRTFNDSMKNNLDLFIDKLKDKNIEFTCEDFRDIQFKDNSFVYCDPPYLISSYCYGKENVWSQKDDTDLMNLLDRLNDQGNKFALSNVLEHKGITNDKLIEWSKKYNVHYLMSDYSNCNYQLKDRDGKNTVEVLITNY